MPLVAAGNMSNCRFGRHVTLRCTGRIAALRAGSENLPKVTRIGPFRWQYHEAGRGGKGHLLDRSHLEGGQVP